MKLKHFLLSGLILTSLVSCSWYEIPESTSKPISTPMITETHYSYEDVTEPYMYYEKYEEEGLYDITLEELLTKVENKDNFILLVYMDGCSSCKNLKEEIIFPFIAENKVKIYGLCTNKEFPKEDESRFISFKNLFSGTKYDFFSYDSKGTVDGMTVPVTMIMSEGKLIDHTHGYKAAYREIIPNMFNAYFKF